ncbi:hypothetical protein CP556_00850 [Natrinema sp. CBA1119]|nr:hypothetical protein CP556_00850 [Natrinema sp. CBA1119]
MPITRRPVRVACRSLAVRFESRADHSPSGSSRVPITRRPVRVACRSLAVRFESRADHSPS